MRKCLLWLTIILFSQPLWAYDFNHIAKQHIVPAYEALQQTTDQLPPATATFCKQPTKVHHQALQTAYLSAAMAWQGAQHLRLGPVQYLMREHRYALWPDKRGTVAKHVRQLLNNPNLLTADFDISQQSVAVQGFSAFEYLLYSDNAAKDTHCQLMAYIAANLNTMSSQLLADWLTGNHPYIQYFSKPGGDNLVYESDEELAGQLLNSLYTQLELIVTQKLARPLGDHLNKAKSKRTEGWRSQSGLPAIAANLEAIKGLYLTAFAPSLGKSLLSQKIETTFNQSQQLIDSIKLPLSEAVSDSSQRQQIEQLQQQLSKLKGYIGRDMAAKLGLSLGFNSLDGD